jgi:hypothetical protein
MSSLATQQPQSLVQKQLTHQHSSSDLDQLSRDQMVNALAEVEASEREARNQRDHLRDELRRVLPGKLFQAESLHSALLQARAKLRERLGITK